MKIFDSEKSRFHLVIRDGVLPEGKRVSLLDDLAYYLYNIKSSTTVVKVD